MIVVLEYTSIVLGAFFMLVASIGVLRLQDFFLRVHAPTKAATMGLFFLLLAFACRIGDVQMVFKAFLSLLFLGLTIPIGAHLLVRSAYRSGIRPLGPPQVDEYHP